MLGVSRGRVARIVPGVLAGRVVDADVKDLLDHVAGEEVDLLEAIAAQIVVFALFRARAVVWQLAEILARRSVERGGGRPCPRREKRQSEDAAHPRRGAVPATATFRHHDLRSIPLRFRDAPLARWYGRMRQFCNGAMGVAPNVPLIGLAVVIGRSMDGQGKDRAQSGRIPREAAPWGPTSRSIFARYATRRPSVLIVCVVGGFLLGLGYRLAFNPEVERTLPYFLRSGLHGVGLGLTVWTVQTGTGVGSPLGGALRRLPLVAEVVVRAIVMTAALIIVGVALQILLYPEFQPNWLTDDLPRIVVVSFGLSIVIGVVMEIERLIGGPLLMSALLGVYHRPTRRRLIVMFLDLANSTRLAETMGEVKVHDLITRFFFDIDEPIADHGGQVHAYVGDEVIVSWPLGNDPTRNARCLSCFAAIERRMEALGPTYAAEFGVAPTFRAGIHAGTVVVSECGDAKRQLAFFGDTMNVAARLCDYCKSVNARLVISGDLARQLTIPDGVSIGEGDWVEARGRQEHVEAHAIRLAPMSARVTRPF